MKIHHATVTAVIVFASTWIGLAQNAKESRMKLWSPDFTEGGKIPAHFTCDGEDVNPSLSISNAPAIAQSLTLVMDDPDAPRGTWTHWLVWNIPTDTKEIPTKSVPPGAVQGLNDFSKNNYGGPCPPSGTHRYFFKLYALDTVLKLPSSSNRKALDHALQGHVIAEAACMGTYSRSR